MLKDFLKDSNFIKTINGVDVFDTMFDLALDLFGVKWLVCQVADLAMDKVNNFLSVVYSKIFEEPKGSERYVSELKRVRS